MITAAQIDRWRASPSEHARLEFKEARTGFGVDRLCAYCVAIANEGGGRLVLGVADAPPRPVVGSSALGNPSGTVARVRDSVGFHVDIDAIDHPDGRVVVVTIPGRPLGSAYHLDGRYLMRSGESLVAMSEDRLRSIFAEGRPGWLEGESRIGLSAQEVVDALDVQGYFELLRMPLPSSQDTMLERLASDRLVARGHGGYAVRRLGAITLARRLADFPDVARKAARVVVYGGTSKLRTTVDQTWPGGYATGFRDLVRFVMSHVPQHEVVRNVVRTSVALAPEIVVRELVANALVHQDFAMDGMSVMIEIYADRLEISNPGRAIVAPDRFIDGYQSRNDRLADLMRRMGLCEEKGSGIDRVVQAAEAMVLPAPQFREDCNRVSVVVGRPKPFAEMDRNERMLACYQHAGLRRVMNDFMTNQSLRARFGLAESASAAISRVLQDAVKAGLVRSIGPLDSDRKRRRYVPYWD